MLKINGEEVKIVEYEDKDGNKKTSYQCSAFVDDISNKNNFYENKIIENFQKNHETPLTKEEIEHYRKFAATNFAYGLHNYDWELTGVVIDQWMGVYIDDYDRNRSIAIECDCVEYGLIAAYMIVEHLDGKNNN